MSKTAALLSGLLVTTVTCAYAAGAGTPTRSGTLTDAETTKILQALLDRQRDRFARVESIYYRSRTEIYDGARSGGLRLRPPRISAGELFLQGECFAAFQNYTVIHYDDAGMSGEAFENFGFDGKTYVTIDGHNREIALGSRKYVPDHLRNESPLGALRTPLEQVFTWALFPDEETSFRRLRQPQTWQSSRFIVDKIEELNDTTHSICRVTFLREAPNLPRPVAYAISFARDVDCLPIEQHVTIQEKVGQAPRESSRVFVHDWFTTTTSAGQVVLPLSAVFEALPPDGRVSWREAHRIIPDTIRINETIPVSRFQLPRRLPGYLVYDRDSKKELTSEEDKRAWWKYAVAKDPITEGSTTESRYLLRGDYTAEVRFAAKTGSTEGHEFRVYYTHGRDPMLFTSGTIGADDRVLIQELCGGDESVRYQVYVDRTHVGRIHMTTPEKRRSYTFQVPALVHHQLPQIELIDLLTSKPQSLSSLLGRPTVVEMWGRFCAPCQPTMTHLNDFAATCTRLRKDECPLNFVAVTSDESTSAVVEHVQQKRWNRLKHYLCTEETFARLVGAEGIPLCLVIDKGGKILWRGNPPSDELDNLLKRLTE
jgi:thiol-disulfide isomerase/thioredoxin